MRAMMQDQLPLMQPFVGHDHGRELEVMSAILDKIPQVLKLLDRDVTQGRKRDVGRPGMTSEQVLRARVQLRTRGRGSLRRAGPPDQDRLGRKVPGP